jgi:hypothetical protein
VRVKDDGRRDEPMGESERWNNISVVTLAVVVSTSRWPFVNVFREAVLRAKTTISLYAECSGFDCNSCLLQQVTVSRGGGCLARCGLAQC